MFKHSIYRRSQLICFAFLAITLATRANSSLPECSILNSSDKLDRQQSRQLAEFLTREVPTRLPYPEMATPRDFVTAESYLQFCAHQEERHHGLVRLSPTRYVFFATLGNGEPVRYRYDIAMLLGYKDNKWGYVADTLHQMSFELKVDGGRDKYVIENGAYSDISAGNYNAQWQEAILIDLDGDGKEELLMDALAWKYGTHEIFVLKIDSSAISYLKFPDSRYPDKEGNVLFESECGVSEPKFQPGNPGTEIVCNRARWIRRGDTMVLLGTLPDSTTTLDLVKIEEMDSDEEESRLEYAAAIVSPQIVTKGELTELLKKDYHARLKGDSPSAAESPADFSGLFFDEAHLYQTCLATENGKRKAVVYLGNYALGNEASIDWSTLVVGALKTSPSRVTKTPRPVGAVDLRVSYGGAYLILTPSPKPRPKKTLDDNNPNAPVKSSYGTGLGRFFTNYQRFEVPLCAILAPGAQQFAEDDKQDRLLPIIWAKYKNSKKILLAQPQIWIEGNFQQAE